MFKYIAVIYYHDSCLSSLSFSKAKKLHPEHEDKSDGEGEVTDEDEAGEIDPEVYDIHMYMH